MAEYLDKSGLTYLWGKLKTYIANSTVPPTRKVNNKALSADISLAASDVGAVPTTRTVNSKALSSNISLTAADVGAVPTSRTVNNKALSGNITLSASDVGALPSSTAIPSKTSDLTNDSGFPVKSTTTITLTAAGWSNKTQTVSATGVTASNTVIVAPVGATDAANWASGSVWCTAQGAGTLTFVCDTVPTAAISVNVVILG